MNIKILNDCNRELDYKNFLFSGGEVSIKLDYQNLAFFDVLNEYTIIARLQNSEDVFTLSLIKDALVRIKNKPIKLVIPYMPYGRQDRVCDRGESFSLKVFADYINFLKFDKVITFDPHSDVIGALFDNLKIISQFDIFNNSQYIIEEIIKNQYIFVSPDAGANKKTSKLAGYFNHKEFIRADKLRDLSNGNILETIVYADDLSGQNCMIVDDIADGGATFIFLAKELKKKNAQKVTLYVTHGIFSKGIDVFDDIDEIITLNSFKSFEGNNVDKLRVLNVDNYL